MEYEAPWVEKYRPTNLSQVTGNNKAIATLEQFAKNGNIPHLLLVGPPGTGKTTSVLCLARQMLGEELLKSAVLELNASDDRGIDVVRENIKSFAQKQVTVPQGMHKIIILDEADSMTDGAQQALRMIMTNFSSTTRFALACNESSKIIEPIQSRCAILRFTRLSDSDMQIRLSQVAQSEKLTMDPKAMEALIFTAEGDMRNGINNLQATAAANNNVIDYDSVFRICDQPHPEIIKEILEKCLQNLYKSAQDATLFLQKQGYSPLDIVTQLYKVTSYYETNRIPQEIQLEYLKILTILKLKILDGTDTMLQVHGTLAQMCQLSAEKCLKMEV